MKFAQDTRTNPVQEPEVQLLEDGTALSNRVKVVVQIDAEDIGGMQPTDPSDPEAEPAPEAGAPTVLSLPLPASGSGRRRPRRTRRPPPLPETNPKPGAPAAPTVQIEAQLEVVEPPAPEETRAPGAASTPEDCPPDQGE